MTVSPPATVLANSTDLEISAAVDGLGIIRTFEELLIPAINAGRLRAFVDFLKAEQRQSQG